MSGSLKKHKWSMKREYVSKRGKTTNQSTKFQNLKVAD